MGDADYGDGSGSSIARSAATQIQAGYRRPTDVSGKNLSQGDPKGPPVAVSAPSTQPPMRNNIIHLGRGVIGDLDN
jgi:hypothetical protein